MAKIKTSLERRRQEVLRAYAKGEDINSIMERICEKYDIRPNTFWVDWAKIRPDRQDNSESIAAFGQKFEAAAHKENNQ